MGEISRLARMVEVDEDGVQVFPRVKRASKKPKCPTKCKVCKGGKKGWVPACEDCPGQRRCY